MLMEISSREGNIDNVEKEERNVEVRFLSG